MRIIRHLGYSCTRSEIQTMLKGIKPDDKDDVEFDGKWLNRVHCITVLLLTIMV